MHVSCLRHNADRKCYECKTEFPLKDLVSLKRHQKEDAKKNEGESTQERKEEEEDEDLQGLRKRRKLESPEKRTVFMSIKDDQTAINLDKYIKELKAKSEQINAQTENQVLKTRKNAKENFTYSLLLGIEEAKERGDFDKIVSLMNFQSTEEPDKQSIHEYASKIASGIESGMFAKYELQIVSSLYKLDFNIEQ